MRHAPTSGDRRNIRRVVYQKKNGGAWTRQWQVNFRVKGFRSICVSFSDSVHGGKEEAFIAATRLRDAFEHEFAASERVHGNFGRFERGGTSGINRTCSTHVTKTGEKREYWSWQAQWPGIRTSRVSKRFSDSLHGGSDRAKVAAEAARAKGVAEYLDHLKRNPITPVTAAASRDRKRAPYTLFMPPENLDVRVWRYMDFTKFVSMLENRGLFLPVVAKLDDPFEGSYARGNEALRPIVHKYIPNAFNLTAGEMVQRLRAFVPASCWHSNEQESAAMWKLYAKTNEAVCVQTTFCKLRDAMGSTARVGMVRYVDYETDWIPESNPLAPFLYKRKSFEHEHEVRALIPPPNIADILQGAATEPDDAGKWVKMDIAKTVERVFIAPDAPDWFLELVNQVTSRYEQGAVPVVRSALARGPFY